MQQRALAGAVAAEQYDEFTGADMEVDAAHDLRLAVGDIQPIHLQQRLGWSG